MSANKEMRQNRWRFKMKLVPLADRVVLKQSTPEEKTKSGIILTSQTQEKPQQAESCCSRSRWSN